MSNEENNKKIETIDDLAVMMQSEFSRMDTSIDKKLEKVKKELKDDIRENRNMIEKAVGQSKENKQEITMMGNRVTRNTDNIAKLADSTDTEIE